MHAGSIMHAIKLLRLSVLFLLTLYPGFFGETKSNIDQNEIVCHVKTEPEV